MSEEEEIVSQSCSKCGSEYSKGMKFCPSCGASLDKSAALPSTKDFFKEFVNYDPNIWGTLKTLILKPGKLTSQFLEGDHSKVTSPAKLFIIISAIAFLVGTISVVGDSKNEQQPEEVVINEGEKPGLQLEIQTSTGLVIHNIDYYKDEIDSLGADKFLQSRNTQLNPVMYWVVKRTVEKYQKNDYEEINTNHERNASFLLYLLIPIFAFFMKVFRWKRSFTEHLTFTLYFFSAFYLIQLLWKIVGRVIGWFFPEPWLGLAVVPLVLIVAYLISAIHKNYQFGWINSGLIGLLTGTLLLVSTALLLFFASLLILSL